MISSEIRLLIQKQLMKVICITEIIVARLINSKNIWSSKDYSGYRFCLLIGDGTCRITVGCWWGTYPSIHFLHGAGTLKITVGCQTSTWPSIRTKPAYTSWTPWFAPQKKRKLWARTPVLSPALSQASHSHSSFVHIHSFSF